MSVGSFEWKYGDCSTGVLASMNPLRWSSRAPVKSYGDVPCGSRPVIVRYFAPANAQGQNFVAARLYNSSTDARTNLQLLASIGVPLKYDKTCWDSWDPLRLTGPDGVVSQGLEFVPIAGHIVNATNRGLGRERQGSRGGARCSTVTGYVPILGHIQYFAHEDSKIAEQSLARANGMTAGIVAGWYAGPALAAYFRAGAIAEVAMGGAAAGVAQSATQAGSEALWVHPDYHEKANQGIQGWAQDIGVGAAVGIACSFGTPALNSAWGWLVDDQVAKAVCSGAAEGIEAVGREGVASVGDAIIQQSVSRSLARQAAQEIAEEVTDDLANLLLEELAKGLSGLTKEGAVSSLGSEGWAQLKATAQANLGGREGLDNLVKHVKETEYGGSPYNMGITA